MDWHEGKRNLGMQMLIYDGMAWSVMYSFTSTFLVAFALYLGASSMYIGLLSALPTFFWTVMLIPAAMLAQKFIIRRKEIVIGFSLLSRFMWAGIILIPVFVGINALSVLLVLIILSTTLGAFCSPAWSSMIGDLVPDNIRGGYFSKRNLLTTFAGLISVMFAGWMLDWFGRENANGFIVIFMIGLAFGLLSLWFFSRIPNPPAAKEEKRSYRNALVEAVRDRKFRRFLILLFVWQFGVMFASPFFNVQLLEVLKADYIWISILAIVGGISGIIVSRAWGRFSDRYGHRVITIISSFGCALLPLLWIFVPTPWFLVPVEILSGIAWMGFNLGNFNYMLESSKPRSRAMYSALFNIIFGIGGIVAPVLGGLTAEFFRNSSLFGLTYLQPVFLVSFIIRISAAVLFLKFLKETILSRPSIPVGYVAGEMLRKGLEGGIMKLIYAGKTAVRDVIYIEHAIVDGTKKSERHATRILAKVESVLERIAIYADRKVDAILKGHEEIERNSGVVFEESRLKKYSKEKD